MTIKAQTVKIQSQEIAVRSGTGDRGHWEARTQAGWLDRGDLYPEKLKIRLKDGASAWAPGEYQIDWAQSVFIGKYGSLVLSEELVLVPLAASGK